MIDKECKNCGDVFTPHSPVQKKCSSCIPKLDKRRAGQPYKAKKACKECGKEFTATGRNQKYCSKECGSIRKYHLKRNYNLSLSDYNNMKEGFGTDCMICGCETVENSRGRNNLCIDHCHTTGAVRGFLCHHCNCALGMFKDSTELLGKAIEYLNQSEERATTIENLKKGE